MMDPRENAIKFFKFFVDNFLGQGYTLAPFAKVKKLFFVKKIIKGVVFLWLYGMIV